MTGKLSKEEAAELMELATLWADAVREWHLSSISERANVSNRRAAFERRLAELTEG